MRPIFSVILSKPMQKYITSLIKEDDYGYENVI